MADMKSLTLNGVKYDIVDANAVHFTEAAAVGQTIRVSAVDENGKPTAWEAVDMASGGGSEWEDIVDITTTEEVTSINITTDKDGNAFSLLEADVYIFVVKTDTNTAEAALKIRTNFNTAAKGGDNTMATRMFRPGSGGGQTVGMTLNCRSGNIKGVINNIGNVTNATSGYFNINAETLTAMFLSGGTFGVGSRVIIKGVRAK